MSTVYFSNIDPNVTEKEIHTLFSLIGPVVSIDIDTQKGAKHVTVVYAQAQDAFVAFHLEDTMIGDYPLCVSSTKPPFEGLKLSKRGGSEVTEHQTQTQTLSNALVHSNSVKMDAPAFHVNLNAQRQDEVARTLYVGNIDPDATEDQVINYFTQCGPVAYCRLAGDRSRTDSKYAFVEYLDLETTKRALELNGKELHGRSLKINASKNPIVKSWPLAESSDEQKELQNMKRFVRNMVAGW